MILVGGSFHQQWEIQRCANVVSLGEEWRLTWARHVWYMVLQVSSRVQHGGLLIKWQIKSQKDELFCVFDFSLPDLILRLAMLDTASGNISRSPSLMVR